jgi:hypothetical protein
MATLSSTLSRGYPDAFGRASAPGAPMSSYPASSYPGRPLPLSSSLRPWLRGQWALLFSHADDFACHDLESDRWAVVLEQSLDAAHVRPVALTSRIDAGFESWVTQAGGAFVTIAPEEPRRGPRLIDLQARALRDAVERSSSRFVMIVDESLRLHRTFAYAPGDRLPSPLDLVAMAGRLRSASRAAA